jgi:uncharacterized membrane protein YvbJ
MIRCEACGTENPADAAYCSNCARKLDPDTQEAVARQRAEHTATGIRWSAVLSAVIAVVIILLIVLFVTHVI